MEKEPIRLQKYFTDCGVLSRRAAEAEIEAGRVKVNGETAEVGQKILPGIDRVEYRGKEIKPPARSTHTYIMLNKPRGYLTSMTDDRGRKCVTELVSDVGRRVYPVGRLDLESEGLLLLTDDGDLTYRLTHPRHEIPKIYHVRIEGDVDEAQIKALSQPIELDGYMTLPVEISLLSRRDNATILRMVLYEGRNRRIRRMCAAQGLKVLRLCRVGRRRMNRWMTRIGVLAALLLLLLPGVATAQ
ncbi:MAG: rRNA pseudouridine synthase, partial [Clostridia bacterium]|nr:rRNA pseudouridine synthase [Clostridia bacterium]